MSYTSLPRGRRRAAVEPLETRRLLSAAYSLVDLGTLGGTESYAYDLNDNNVVVGYAKTASGQDRAFRFFDANGNRVADAGEMVSLNTLAGDAASYAYGLNDAGQIVGTSRSVNLGADGDERAVRFNPGSAPTNLGLGDGSNAFEINEAGQIVGGAVFNLFNYHAFLRSPNGQVTSFALTGTEFGRYAEAHGINDAGVAVGYSGGDFGATGVVRAANGTLTPVGFDSPEFLDYNYAWDVNASGQIVGEGYNPAGNYRAFRAHNGTVTDLGTLAGFGSSQALGINDAGVIVGRAEPVEGAGGVSHAFVYSAGQMRDLNSLIPAGTGWTLTDAREVNDNGAIVGWGVSPSGATRAFLLLPAGASAVDAHVFYNASNFDGSTSQVPDGPNDDAAVAPDKDPLRPGQTATEANFTNFSKGINGVMIDVEGLPTTSLTANDFEFRVGNNNTPSGWALAPAPTGITVRDGAGVGGTDRVTIKWANNAIRRTWLQVTVKANTATGLAAPEVFYFGNLPGDTFNRTPTQTTFTVNSLDLQRVRNALFQNAGSLTSPNSAFDIDKSGGNINSIDLQLVRNNQFASLNVITPPVVAAASTSPSAPVFLSAAAAPTRTGDDLPEELD